MATCIDCKLRGWSETIDENGKVTRTGEVIDLCPLHAAAEDMLMQLKEHQRGHLHKPSLDALVARVEGTVPDAKT